jgi:hypothetical protein
MNSQNDKRQELKLFLIVGISFSIEKKAFKVKDFKQRGVVSPPLLSPIIAGE